MNIYKWLEQVKKLDELISAKTAERDKLLDLAKKITPELSGMPHASGISDKVGSSAVKLADLAKKTDDLIDLYTNHKNKVLAALELLPANQYGVLHRHYIRYMPFEKIAEDMDKSTSQVYRYRKKGIKKLKMIVNDSIDGDIIIP